MVGGHKVVKKHFSQWLGNSQMDFYCNDRNGSSSSHGVLGSTLCFVAGLENDQMTANSSTTLNVQIRNARKFPLGWG